MDDRDRRHYHEEAGMLLSKSLWTSGDLDQAVTIHDLLEAPEGPPDAAARNIRARLIGELQKRLAVAESPVARVRLEFFSSFMLDAADPLARRLSVLLYRGVTSFHGYSDGAGGQLDAAIEAFRELDRLVAAEGPRASSLLRGNYDAGLMG